MLERVLAYHREQLAANQQVLDTDGNLYSGEQRTAARHAVNRHTALIAEIERVAGGAVLRHKKRGSTYAVLGDALLQTERPLRDEDTVTVYRDRETGALFARAPEEMTDGRFEEASS